MSSLHPWVKAAKLFLGWIPRSKYTSCCKIHLDTIIRTWQVRQIVWSILIYLGYEAKYTPNRNWYSMSMIQDSSATVDILVCAIGQWPRQWCNNACWNPYNSGISPWSYAPPLTSCEQLLDIRGVVIELWLSRMYSSTCIYTSGHIEKYHGAL